MHASDTDDGHGKAKRDGEFFVLDEGFNSQLAFLDDLKVNGKQIAEAAGFRSADEVIVLQQLDSGALEEIREEELVDLTKPGIERFFVMVGDRTYRFVLDGLKLEWPRESFPAEVIRKLAGKDESFEVVQEMEDVADHVLDDEDMVSLKGQGTERFKTRKASKLLTVYYSDAPFELPRGVYLTEDLHAKYAVEPGYLLDLVEGGKLIELKPGQKIRLKEGMHFVSHPPRGQSS